MQQPECRDQLPKEVAHCPAQGMLEGGLGTKYDKMNSPKEELVIDDGANKGSGFSPCPIQPRHSFPGHPSHPPLPPVLCVSREQGEERVQRLEGTRAGPRR